MTKLNAALLVVSLLSLVAANATANPTDWPEGNPDRDDGATRDFYNRGAGLRWEHFQGDWTDRDGTPQGDAHWSLATIEDTDSERYVEWEVTDLVNAWLNGDVVNQGFILRAVSPGRNLVFTSRQGPEEQHPELVVETAEGTLVLSPEADTHLPESTYQAQGREASMSVGENATLLARFPLDSVAGPVASARLRLFTTRQYDSIDVAVDAVVTGRRGPAPEVEWGIAADYAGDDGIAAHPAVVMADDFSGDWASRWTNVSGHYDVLESSPEDGFEPLDGPAFRMTMVEGDNYGGSLHFDFADELGAEPERAHLRYYLRFGSSWSPSSGGKLPGLSGTYGVAGWGGRPVDGTNGWSARGLYNVPIPDTDTDNALAGHTPIGSYVYHADMEGQFGDNYLWTDPLGPEGYGGVLERERWYCVEVMVQMNEPGANDGIIRGWIDGRLSFETTTMSFRTVDTLLIERVWMNIFHGGTAVAPSDMHVYFDNVVVADSYIGPMGSAQACGDGVIDEGEGCDDGNTVDGDGCNAICDIESGYVCDGEPSVCTEIPEDVSPDAGDVGLDTGAATDTGVADDSGSHADSDVDNTDTRVETDTEATDDAGADTDAAETANTSDEGCSCSSTPTPRAAGWGLALVGLMTLRRRRAAAR